MSHPLFWNLTIRTLFFAIVTKGSRSHRSSRCRLLLWLFLRLIQPYLRSLSNRPCTSVYEFRLLLLLYLCYSLLHFPLSVYCDNGGAAVIECNPIHLVSRICLLTPIWLVLSFPDIFSPNLHSGFCFRLLLSYPMVYKRHVCRDPNLNPVS